MPTRPCGNGRMRGCERPAPYGAPMLAHARTVVREEEYGFPPAALGERSSGLGDGVMGARTTQGPDPLSGSGP